MRVRACVATQLNAMSLLARVALGGLVFFVYHKIMFSFLIPRPRNDGRDWRKAKIIPRIYRIMHYMGIMPPPGVHSYVLPPRWPAWKKWVYEFFNLPRTVVMGLVIVLFLSILVVESWTLGVSFPTLVAGLELSVEEAKNDAAAPTPTDPLLVGKENENENENVIGSTPE